MRGEISRGESEISRGESEEHAMRGDWGGDWERGAREARETRGEISSRGESEISRGESEGAEAARRERSPHEPPSSSRRLSTCCARDGGEALGSAPSAAPG